MKIKELFTPVIIVCSVFAIDSSAFAQNTAYGTGALASDTTGYDNSAFGYDALNHNTTGYYNTGVGKQTIYSDTTDYGNAGIATFALYALTSGSENTAVGAGSLDAVTTGSDNVALGYDAGKGISTGSWNVYLGSRAGGFGTEYNTIRIGIQGTQTNAFVAGVYGQTAASGVAVYVNSSGQLGTLTSSARFKENVKSMGDASTELLSLRPVTFRYKPELDSQGIPQYGLIAEEVAKVDPGLVACDDKNQAYTVRYQAIDAMLLNEFIKQHQTVEEQKAEITALKEKASNLEQRLNGLANSVQVPSQSK